MRNIYSLKLLWLLFLMVASAEAWGQAVKVSGTVKDEIGTPMVGVTIRVQGQQQGALTNDKGEFTLSGVQLTDSLVISSIGYRSQVIGVRFRKNFNIILHANEGSLNEVTVVGYGKQKKVSVVGAISTVDVKKLNMPGRDLSNALAGRLAGMIAVQRSGEPGYDGSDFWIRGIGTFGAKRDPLVMVDGVPRSLNDIDPMSIASFSVLKDATATAIYGVQGANGVILIKTKRGKAGPPVIDFRTEYAVTGPTRLPRYVGGADYMELYNEARRNSGRPEVYSRERIDRTRSHYDPDLFPDVNWEDVIMKNFSANQRVQLTISGGGNKIRYFGMGSYYHEAGLFKIDPGLHYNTNFSTGRYNFRSNLDFDVTPTTSLHLGLGGYLTRRKAPGTATGTIFFTALATTPVVFPARYSDGTLAGDVSTDNPYNQAMESGYYDEWFTTMQSAVTLDQKLDLITPGLSAKILFSFDSYNSVNLQRLKTPTQYLATGRDADGKLVFGQPRVAGQEFLNFSKSITGTEQTYLQAEIDYSRSFGESRFGGLLLFNKRSFTDAGANSSIDALPHNNQGIAGRVTYGYKSRYFAEFNFGYNGSENFAPGKRYGFFPSIAAGWLVSGEPFMKSVSNTATLVKLRASYGQAGNDVIGGRRFAYLSTIAGGSGYSYGVTNYRSGLAEGDFGNPDLTWETSTKANIGLDLGLFNLVTLNVDAFREERSGIFLQRESVPETAGYNNLPWANYGKVRNQGIDMTINYDQTFPGDIHINIRGVFTYAHNTITEMDEPDFKYAYQQHTGHRIGQEFGLIAEGLYTKDDFDADGNLKKGLPVPTFSPVEPGDIKYRDMNADSVIDSYDESAIGKAFDPEIVYGLGATIDGLKNFDINFFFQGVANTTTLAINDYVYPFAIGNARNNLFANVLSSRWTKEDPSQDVYWPRITDGAIANNTENSTWWLKNAGFIRLKELAIGYTIPRRIREKIHSTNFRVFVRATNILTWDHIGLWDPEIGSNVGAQYPPNKTYSLGLNVTF